MGSEPKAHHFIPVGHLARFASETSGSPRDARLWVYDKTSGATRPARAGKVAIENDLYTLRTPVVPATAESLKGLAEAISAASKKDRFLETDKADIEQRGVRGLRELETMPVGEHRLAEEERAGVVAYVALLFTQHPTMMRRRSALIAERFWAAVGPRFRDMTGARAVFADLDRGMSVLGLIPEQLVLALELNYLAWSVVRWRDAPSLVMGDNAAIAQFPGKTLGVGDAWTPGALFIVPISSTSALFMGGFEPGLCRVEDRSAARGKDEVRSLNVVSWVRAAREVYAPSSEALAEAMTALGPLGPGMAAPDQLEIRESLLPGFRVDSAGQLEILEPPDALADDHGARFEARFGSAPRETEAGSEDM